MIRTRIRTKLWPFVWRSQFSFCANACKGLDSGLLMESNLAIPESPAVVSAPAAAFHDTQPSKIRMPELLSPAGDWECAKAAVENGADAIYFGLEKFNVRMRAHNFTEADLPELIMFLHRRGMKAYVTFNTLVFENEMAQAEHYARAMIT